MAKALMLVRHPPEMWRQMLTQPEDRSAKVRAAVEAAGGTLEAMNFLVGRHDFMTIIGAPDETSLAAALLAVTAIGAFVEVEVYPIFDLTGLPRMFAQAGKGLAAVITD